MSPRPPRILVLRGGALGDFIVTLPALRALRERWPAAHVELLAYPHIAELAVLGGLVDRVRSLHGAHVARFFSLRPQLPPEQVDYVRSFDLIVNYLHDPDFTVRDNLTAAGALQVLSGSPLVEQGHAVDQFLRPLESLAIYAAGAAPALALPQADRDLGRALLAERAGSPPVVVLHPGSGSARKNWPAGCYLALARQLAREHGWRPLFLLGEADEEPARALRDHAPDIPRAGNLGIPDVARLLSAAQAYVGNDSGITHLAAAVGAPTLALFGPTDPAQWGPRGDHVQVLRAERGELDALSVDDVARAFGARFGAR